MFIVRTYTFTYKSIGLDSMCTGGLALLSGIFMPLISTPPHPYQTFTHGYTYIYILFIVFICLHIYQLYILIRIYYIPKYRHSSMQKGVGWCYPASLCL